MNTKEKKIEITYKERVKAAHRVWFEDEVFIAKAAEEFAVSYQDILRYHFRRHPLLWLMLEGSALYHRIRRRLCR